MMHKKPLLIQLLSLVKPFIMIMVIAIILGVLGHLLASLITIVAIMTLTKMITINTAMMIIILCALLRGICRYIEQACNHYIAFKVLAHIRHLLFEKLRELAIAKLDGKQRGQLITALTSDVETLEVFFAHTISPVMIALIYTVIVLVLIAHYSIEFMFVAFIAYIIMGIIIPWLIYRLSIHQGNSYRQDQSAFESFILESILSKQEFLLFDYQNQRIEQMLDDQQKLENTRYELIKKQTLQQQLSQSLIIVTMTTMIVLGVILVSHGYEFKNILLVIMIVSCCFGPTIALANLANNLNQVIPCAKRITTLLQEEPLVKEVTNQNETLSLPLVCQNLTFHYPHLEKLIFDGFSGKFELGKTYGIYGPSGCGKSTLLKLIMRVYQTHNQILFNGEPVENINSSTLKEMISYVSQETFMFHESLYHNITLFQEHYTKQDVEKACKQARIHDFIMSLPQGYQTIFDDNLSSGQIQRIALARAFIRKSPIILLDEPTSHVDSLNEALILKSLTKIKQDHLLILVTHRPSTLSICDEVIEIQS